jgi:hypothetical protein
MKKHKWIYSFLAVIVLGLLIFSLKEFLSPPTKEVSQVGKEIKTMQKYSFVYSHPLDNKTYLLSTQNGANFEERKFKVADIFDIQTNALKENSLLLFPTHNKQYYELDNDNNLKKKSIRDPLTFFQEKKQLTIKSFNISKDSNLLEVQDREKNKHYNLKFPTFLVDSFSDEKNIYVINNMVDEEKSSLQVVDRNAGKLVKTISLESPASDIAKMDNNLIVTTDKGLSIISLAGLQVKEVDYPVKNIMADQIFVDNKKVFISYGDYSNGNAHLLVLDKDFNLASNIDFKVPYTKSKFKNEKLYVLSQYEEGKKYGGQFNAINLNTLKQDKTILLPKKDIKVQDFVVY